MQRRSPYSWRYGFGAVCATSALTLTLSGCGGGSGGGGGGGTTVDTAGSAAAVEQGRTQLNTILTSTSDPTTTKLTQLRTTFQTAHNKDSGNMQAMMGFAMSDLAVHVQGVIDVAASTSKAQSGSNDLADAARQAVPWSVTVPRAKNFSKTVHLALSLPGTLSRKRSVDPDAVRTKVTALRDALNQDIPMMETIAAKSDFSFVIADFKTRKGTRTIDAADVKGMVAALYTARALLNLALSYDWNPRGFNFDVKLKNYAKASDGTLTPDEYLPPAPFGTLVSGGKSTFQAVKTDLTKGADTVLATISALAARKSASGHLIDSTDLDLTPQSIQEATLSVQEFRAALSSTWTAEDGTKINLAAWFNDPPTSLRIFRPTYKRDAILGYWVSQPVADPTFGGLIPNGKQPTAEVASDDDSLGNVASGTGYAFTF